MNIRQLFFVSLIILSVAMGINWFKNKPKFVAKKQPSRNRQAVDINDLELKKEQEKQNLEKEQQEAAQKSGKKANNDEEFEEEEEEEGEEEEGTKNDREEVEEVEEGEETEEGDIVQKPDSESITASESVNITASDSLSIDNPLKDDPILQDYFKITRNPFETSPYAQLVEKLRLEAELAAMPEEKEEEEVVKKITTIRGNFTGTIETSRGLRAIIDGNLYLKGDEYQHHKITEITNETVIMDTEAETFLVPKVGVTITTDKEKGEYTVIDTYDE